MPAAIGGEQVWVMGQTGVTDQSGNGRNGTLSGGSSIVSDTGSSGISAFSFDGVNGLCSFGNACNPGTGSYTAAAWIKASSSLVADGGSGSRPFQKRGTGAAGGGFPGFACNISKSGSNIVITGSNASIVESSSTQFYLNAPATLATVSTWFLLVVEIDRTGNAFRHFVNGAQITSASIAGITGNLDNTRSLTLGGSDVSATQYYAGLIDDFRIFNRILTPTEKSNWYTNGRGNGGSNQRRRAAQRSIQGTF